MPLTDLPLDILVLVFPYLDAESFLALTSTCKAFNQDSIRLDPTYWRHATQTAFRVPNQPVVEYDGARWQKLYRRLLTQSHVFTWGNTDNQRLGHSFRERITRPGRQIWNQQLRCSFPTEMEHTEELGIIADMQCGGWSTTLLTSKGTLHTTGVLDGQSNLHIPGRDGPYGPQPLRFPTAYHSAACAPYYEPTTAIQQFSAGRQHILGLSDSGKIWTWYAANKPCLQIKFLDMELRETSIADSVTTSSTHGRVKKVVAGWSRSSAYVYGVGIVVWDPMVRGADDDQTDTMLVVTNAEIPRTAYQRVKGAPRESKEEAALKAEVGAVLNYILLEHYVVFVTDIGRVFCARFGERNQVEDILELRALRHDNGSHIDVQGSFRSLAIFKGGEVITIDQGYLDACWNTRQNNPEQTEIEGPKRIPALQHNDVISIAFGDYHFLALHSTGKITSYGTELQACGALGLGGDGDPEGRIRGIRYVQRDGRLLPHAYTSGRQVWFELEKKKWMTFMSSGGKDPGEAKERLRMYTTQPSVQGEISEWFEQQGRDWDKDPELQEAADDGLGSYFALSISAAGWHSGAIVLVNEDLAERVRDRCIIKDPEQDSEDESSPSHWSLGTWIPNSTRALLGFQGADQQPRYDPNSGFLDPISHGASPKKGYSYTWAYKSFPRLKLSDGREMPGEVDFDEWRYGRPEWQLDFDV
ncbi:RCC1/BLIP-II [Pleomassaria siparia CBS 279.74]|uniref:RCC1/BLIP-II n=1 Tax=Pleomassaria siparia CBS 279.74 TaxID=1314801 RepID=A0A6G1JZF2_9PLEO|nr:RCC1/BLIP-II [Pleomassaria siparia CBS 279.74]